MKRSLSANPSSYGFSEQASYIFINKISMYNIVVLLFCCLVILLNV